MTVDNRTLLNGAENENDNWLGDDAVSNDSTLGSSYQGSQGLSTQFSNSLERMTCFTIGGTRDLSNATVWKLAKANLVQTKANGGFQIVLADGNDEVGFYCGGNDEPPLQLPTFFNSIRLDVSNRAALSNNAYAGGAGTLTTTAITGVGYGTQHLAKANGAIDNTFLDASYFIDNTAYAFTIDGGTAGTPISFSDVVSDDIANGWGCWANLQGSKFDVNASFEFAPSTTNADTYFAASNFQLYVDARDVGAGNLTIRTRGGTGTNVLDLSNGTLVNLGTQVNVDFSDATHDGTSLDNLSWTDFGTFIFGVNNTLNNQTFNNCNTVTQNGAPLNNFSFSGTSGTYALIVDAIANLGTVNAAGENVRLLEGDTSTSLTLTNFTADTITVNNASDVTINLVDSDVTTGVNLGAGNATLVNSKTLTLTNIFNPSKVYLVDLDLPETDANYMLKKELVTTGVFTFDFPSAPVGSGINAEYRVHSLQRVVVETPIALEDENITIPVSQGNERNYANN